MESLMNILLTAILICFIIIMSQLWHIRKYELEVIKQHIGVIHQDLQEWKKRYSVLENQLSLLEDKCRRNNID